MEHDFSSGDISSDDIGDFEEYHEHEPKITYNEIELIAYKNIVVQTIPCIYYA